MIALNITTRDVKLAEIGTENGEKTISKIRQYIPTGEDAKDHFNPTQIIQQFIREESPKSLKTLLIISSQDLDYREFFLPFDSRKKVASAISFEIAAEYPPEEYIVDHIKSISREPGKNTYLAAIAKKEVLASRIKQAKEAGLEIAGITADISILGNFLRNEEETLAMEMEEERTLFALYLHGVPFLIRDIPIGFMDIGKSSNGNEPPDIRTLIGEVKRTIHSFNSKTGLNLRKVFLAGGISGHQDIIGGLKKALDLDFIDQTEGGASAVNTYASLLGAAEWRANGTAFNFLKDDFLESDPAVIGRTFFKWGAILLAFLFIAIILSGWLDLSVLQKRENFLDRSIRKTFTESFPNVKRIVDEVKQAKNILDSKKLEAGGSNLSDQISILDALNIISGSIPKETSFQIVNLFWERGKLEIYGSTDSFKTVNRIHELLAGLKSFSAVNISNAKSRNEGKDVEFTITIRLAE